MISRNYDTSCYKRKCECEQNTQQKNVERKSMNEVSTVIIIITVIKCAPIEYVTKSSNHILTRYILSANTWIVCGWGDRHRRCCQTLEGLHVAHSTCKSKCVHLQIHRHTHVLWHCSLIEISKCYNAIKQSHKIKWSLAFTMSGDTYTNV